MYTCSAHLVEDTFALNQSKYRCASVGDSSYRNQRMGLILSVKLVALSRQSDEIDTQHVAFGSQNLWENSTHFASFKRYGKYCDHSVNICGDKMAI